MADQAAERTDTIADGKYARVERERRFLLAAAPPAADVTASRQITDRYLPRTRLRLRQVEYPDGQRELKLTQKIPAGQPGPVRGLITTAYLNEAEYDLLASIPAPVLVKTRLSVPPLGVDVFGPPLLGLVLAEVEFGTDRAAAAFRPPATVVAEVTDDARFAGGSLVRADRPAVASWLTEYGIGGLASL
jgi:CYTH domain-containing protein